jgi:hypothetical protein
VVVSAGAWLRVDMHQRGGKARQRVQKAVLGSDRYLVRFHGTGAGTAAHPPFGRVQRAGPEARLQPLPYLVGVDAEGPQRRRGAGTRPERGPARRSPARAESRSWQARAVLWPVRCEAAEDGDGVRGGGRVQGMQVLVPVLIDGQEVVGRPIVPGPVVTPEC